MTPFLVFLAITLAFCYLNNVFKEEDEELRKLQDKAITRSRLHLKRRADR